MLVLSRLICVVLSLCFISCGQSFPENKFNHERVGKNLFLAWWIDFYMEGTLEEDFEEHHISEHMYTQQWVRLRHIHMKTNYMTIILFHDIQKIATRAVLMNT